jgi:hypothetical protein
MNSGGLLVRMFTRAHRWPVLSLLNPVHTLTLCKHTFNIDLGPLHHLEVGSVADVLEVEVCAPICHQGWSECSQ